MMNGKIPLLFGILLGCSITYFSTLLTTPQIQYHGQDIVPLESDQSDWEQWGFTRSYKSMVLPGNQIRPVKSMVLSLNTSNLKQLLNQSCWQKSEVNISMALELADETLIYWQLPLMLPLELSCQQVLPLSQPKLTPIRTEQEQEVSLLRISI